MTLDGKRQRLREALSSYSTLLVAYSGGVYSEFLAFEAHRLQTWASPDCIACLYNAKRCNLREC
jgi:PP-loop superfamily ATP-utilizing enzyme